MWSSLNRTRVHELIQWKNKGCATQISSCLEVWWQYCSGCHTQFYDHWKILCWLWTPYGKPSNKNVQDSSEELFFSMVTTPPPPPQTGPQEQPLSVTVQLSGPQPTAMLSGSGPKKQFPFQTPKETLRGNKETSDDSKICKSLKSKWNMLPNEVHGAESLWRS